MARLPGILHTAGMEARLAPEHTGCLQLRLPGEVVVRKRKYKVEEKEDTGEVEIDLKVACSMKPIKRLTWLTNACKMAKDGRTTSTELFNIVTTRRFTFGVSQRLGKTMVDTVYEIMDIFSDKQQRHFSSDEWVLNTYRAVNSAYDAEFGDPADADDSESEKEKLPEEPPDAAPRDEPQASQQEPIKRRRNPEQPIRKIAGGWVTVSRFKEERERREVIETEDRLRARARDRDDQQPEQRQQELRSAKKKQLEEEVDSSMQMLEAMTQQRAPSPRRTETPRDAYGQGRPRDPRAERAAERRELREPRGARRGLSRSRSVSVQLETSPPRRRPRDDKASFEEALRQRMQQRDKEDTTRSSIVQENYQGKKHRRMFY